MARVQKSTALAAAPSEGESSAPRSLELACLAAIALAAVALRLDLAWGDLTALVRDATPDDAYYYFEIARQLAAGGPPSLDGETPTNGFHPLWLLLLLPLAMATRDPLLLLRAGLGVGALLGGVNAVLVWALARAAGARAAAALLASAAYAAHPTVVRESVNGLETALAVATQGLAAWLALRATATAAPGLRACAALGLAGGLMMLARTDAVVVFAALLAGLVLARPREWRRRVAGACVAGALATLLVAPWLVWSAARFGSVVPVSARAVPEPLQRMYIEKHGAAPRVLLARSFEVTRRDLGRAVFLYFAPGREAASAFLALAPLVLAIQLAAPRAPARALRRRFRRLAPAAAGIVATLLVHTAVRWWTREWYYAPLGFLGAVVLALSLDHAAATASLAWPKRRRAAAACANAAAAALLLAALGPPARARWGLRSEHRLSQLEAAAWLAAHTEPDARVGAFNAGILAYFSRRTVVNLDGAVNADALRAREAGRLMEYALGKRLGYLADFRSSLRGARCAESPLARCERLALVGKPGAPFGGRVEVLRIEPRAAAAAPRRRRRRADTRRRANVLSSRSATSAPAVPDGRTAREEGVMHRSEEGSLARCADCRAEIDPGRDRGFGLGEGAALCFECAQRRGGVWDETHDRWSEEPHLRGLAHEVD
jgi:hypothetical protein